MAADLVAARNNMVDSQVRTSDVTDVRIHDAMRQIPREAFTPGKAYLAYADTEVEYAPGRWLLRPREVSKLLQALKPEAGERVLAIAAPYAAVVLEALGLQVDRLDGDDLEAAPAVKYDIVISEGAVARAPSAWLQALEPNGRLGVIERTGPVGKAVLYLATEGGAGRRDLFDATPPVMRGFELQHGFAF
jgi:protein-L-isoaspartate(D-aspartate) O-methyltransferase